VLALATCDTVAAESTIRNMPVVISAPPSEASVILP
jgi:hypothetical protein